MKMRDIKTIGFIGLGVMGEAMCRNIVKADSWAVIAHDLNPEPLARIEKNGAKAATSAQEVAQGADLVISCLPGGNEVRQLLLGPSGLIEQVGDGQIVIDMSTSPPALMQEIAAAANERGAHFADAPVARTRQAAVDGTLSIMVGADKPLFDAIRPVLSTMGRDIVHCGATGAGQVVKIMNNMVVFQTVAALNEAVSIAERAGVSGDLLFETMSNASGDSFVLRSHGMKSILPQDYPEMAFSAKYAAKDLAYALEMAKEHGVRAPGAAHVAELLAEAIEAGDGDLYFPVIRKRLIGR